MTLNLSSDEGLPAETLSFFRRAIQLLDQSQIPFLVGGAYALAHRTGVVRHTKDFDLFLLGQDIPRAIDMFRNAGFQAGMTFEHWLAKAFHGEDFIDLIFSSGNGVCAVDGYWFEHSAAGTVFGQPVRLCPVEETIWQKAFICERERFDGADVNHLLLACAQDLDWRRLLERFGKHWAVLLAQLVLFRFTYPSEEDAVPHWVLEELSARLLQEKASADRVCRGPLLSRIQYERDLKQGGYADGRLEVEGGMTEEQALVWTKAGLGEAQPAQTGRRLPSAQ